MFVTFMILIEMVEYFGCTVWMHSLYRWSTDFLFCLQNMRHNENINYSLDSV